MKDKQKEKVKAKAKANLKVQVNLKAKVKMEKMKAEQKQKQERNLVNLVYKNFSKGGPTQGQMQNLKKKCKLKNLHGVPFNKRQQK